MDVKFARARKTIQLRLNSMTYILKGRLHMQRKATNCREPVRNLLARVVKLAESAIRNSQSILNLDICEFVSNMMIGCPHGLN